VTPTPPTRPRRWRPRCLCRRSPIPCCGSCCAGRSGARPGRRGSSGYRARILDELGRRLDELLVWLGDTPYFFGPLPSAADLAIMAQFRMLQSGPTPQGAELIAMRPRLADYALRVDAATRAG
jgi:glutathione S-transferase